MIQIKTIGLIISFLISSLIFKAQDDYALSSPRDFNKQPAKNSAFIELGGNAGLYSLNFDRIYLYKNDLKLSGRFGFAPEPHGHHFEQGYVIEHNVILFSNPHHLEIGTGVTLQRRYNEKPGLPDNYFWENIWFGVLRAGYRFQKQEDGVFFKTGFTPIMMRNSAEGFDSRYFQFWLGGAIGISF